MFTRLAQLRFVFLLVSLVLLGDAAAWSSQPGGKTGTIQAKSAKKRAKKRPPWYVPTYADSTHDDIAEFDDPLVRQVAVEALGRYNGSVVAMDPNTGRILSIVNQRLAFSAGFQPCSTIKPVVALAALEQNVITRETMIPVGRRRYMNLTEAMAHSDNPFFEELGRRMGFDTFSRYSRLVGLGEPAGYEIFEEHPGVFPASPLSNGDVGRMCSYGEGIQITPLQLAALVSTFANGGSLYYLQYPRTEDARRNFMPRVKRKLNITALLPEIRDGLLAAVLYGTARSSFDPYGEQMLGKTGTCSGQGSRLGWFVSYYADQVQPRIVVVVLLRGRSRRVNGSTAAEIAGRMYQGLRERNFFAENRALHSPVPSSSTH